MSSAAVAVQEANQAFYRAFSALDLEAMDELWARDASVSCLHPGWPLCAGWDEVRASWVSIFANTGEMRFEIIDERVDVRGDLGWVVCVERIRSRGPTGDAMGGAVVATNVFRLDGGTWRLVHHHGSPHVPRRVPPPASPTTRTGGRGAVN